MADNISDEALKAALKQRRKYIEANLECAFSSLVCVTVLPMQPLVPLCLNECVNCSNLTMKACRKLLEEDLGLPEKSLAQRKDFIKKYVDKVLSNFAL